MSTEPSDILGKIGKTVGAEIKSLRTSLTGDLATKVSLGNVQSQVTTNANAISALDDAKASKVSLANYADGTSVFSLLSATRAVTTGDVTVGGNLTVNGTTTTVNSTVVEVEDNAIEVNLAATTGAATANTGGLIINRGKDAEDAFIDKASILFDDSIDKFTMVNLSILSSNKIEALSINASSASLPLLIMSPPVFAVAAPVVAARFTSIALSSTSTTVELTVVVVPLTVRFPPTVTSPVVTARVAERSENTLVPSA